MEGISTAILSSFGWFSLSWLPNPSTLSAECMPGSGPAHWLSTQPLSHSSLSDRRSLLFCTEHVCTIASSTDELGAGWKFALGNLGIWSDDELRCGVSDKVWKVPRYISCLYQSSRKLKNGTFLSFRHK
ncbi:hypothetical protein DL95DRAFT_52254 [Leptodontidium sp. 2 PMI_412]|nr:hypothetical protein DL95DRAFT_52254 [Leptodontidium sp. 2 PMI_412]